MIGLRDLMTRNEIFWVLGFRNYPLSGSVASTANLLSRIAFRETEQPVLTLVYRNLLSRLLFYILTNASGSSGIILKHLQLIVAHQLRSVSIITLN